jgi:hypothetical protein
VLGAGLGFVVLTLATAVAGFATGIEGASAVGLAVFVGAWGGLGFGFMMGGSVALGRRMDLQSTDRSTHR